MHRVRAVCRGVPGRLHLRARPGQPARRSRLARRALRLHLRDQLPLRCIHCDMCVEACPTEAITESKMFEFSFTNRSDAIYTKEELLVDDDGMPKKLPWEDWREGDDLYTSGWMRATSPSGSAAYEGQVQWSGDLGYGVRSPEGGQRAQAGRRHHRLQALAGHPRAPPADQRSPGGQARSSRRHRPDDREGGAVLAQRQPQAQGEGGRRLHQSPLGREQRPGQDGPSGG